MDVKQLCLRYFIPATPIVKNIWEFGILPYLSHLDITCLLLAVWRPKKKIMMRSINHSYIEEFNNRAETREFLESFISRLFEIDNFISFPRDDKAASHIMDFILKSKCSFETSVKFLAISSYEPQISFPYFIEHIKTSPKDDKIPIALKFGSKQMIARPPLILYAIETLNIELLQFLIADFPNDGLLGLQYLDPCFELAFSKEFSIVGPIKRRSICQRMYMMLLEKTTTRCYMMTQLWNRIAMESHPNFRMVEIRKHFRVRMRFLRNCGEIPSASFNLGPAVDYDFVQTYFECDGPLRAHGLANILHRNDAFQSLKYLHDIRKQILDLNDSDIPQLWDCILGHSFVGNYISDDNKDEAFRMLLEMGLPKSPVCFIYAFENSLSTLLDHLVKYKFPFPFTPDNYATIKYILKSNSCESDKEEVLSMLQTLVDAGLLNPPEAKREIIRNFSSRSENQDVE